MKNDSYTFQVNQLRAVYRDLILEKNILTKEINVLEEEYYSENLSMEEKKSLYYDMDEKICAKNGVVDALNQIGNAIEHLGGGVVKSIFE